MDQSWASSTKGSQVEGYVKDLCLKPWKAASPASLANDSHAEGDAKDLSRDPGEPLAG